MIAQLRHYLKRFDVRISVIYGIIAILWISFSDFFPLLFFGDNHAIQAAANTLIGWGFVLVTTGALYLLLSAELRKRERVEKELQLERDISPIAIVVFGTDGRISYANSQAEKTLGQPRSEIIGRLFDDTTFHVTDHDGNPVDVIPIIMQLAQTKQTVYGIQQAVLSAAGRRILLEINLAPLINNNGEITAIVGTFSDVTAAKTHEKQLRDSEERFRLLFNNNPLPVAVYDPDTLEFIEVNDATLDHYGYTRDEFLEMVVPDLRLADDIPELIDDTQKVYRNMQRTERRHRLKSGRIIDVHVTSQMIDYNGRKAIMAVAQDITKRKQAEKALRESEYSLKQAQAIAHVGDWSWDKQNNIIRWSDEMYSIFGIDQSAFTGNPNNIIPLVIHPDDREMGMTINAAMLDGKTPSAWEYRIIWPDGSIRHLRTESGETQFDADGTVLRLSGIVQDITERKQAEQAIRESERSLKRAQSVARVGDWSWDIKTNGLHASDEIYTILGLDKATFKGDLSYIVEHVVHPDDELLLINTIEMSMRGQRPENFECRVVWPDGSVHDIWAEVGEETIDNEGNLTSMSGIIQEITDRKQADRALRDSETSLKLAQAVAHVGSWTLNVQNNTAYGSDEAYRIFGITPDPSSKDFANIMARSLHPDDQPAVIQAISTILKGENPQISECRVLWPDGTVRHVWVELGEVQRDSHGNILQITGIVQDITERKQAEQALRESERSLKNAQAIARVGDWSWDNINKIMHWSDQMYTIFGLDKDTFDGDRNLAIVNAIHPDDRAFGASINRAIIQGQKGVWEVRIVHPDSSVHHIQVEAGASTVDSEGQIVRIAGIMQDITERKLAEQALRDSEASLKRSQAIAHLGNWTQDLRTNTAHWSDEMYRIFGINQDHNIHDLNAVLIAAVHPDDRALVQHANETVIKERTGGIWEFRVVWPDGSVHHIEAETPAPITDADGNILLLSGIVQDITERKAAEQALRESELRYRTLIEQASDGIYLATGDGRFLDVNTSGCHMIDYTREELLHKSIPDVVKFTPERPLRFDEIRQGKTVVNEFELIRSDGTLLAVEISSKQLSDGNIQGIVRDITERKAAEQAVRESELRYRTLIEQASEAIFVAEVNGYYVEANSAACTLLGYTRDEILQKKMLDLFIIPPEKPLRTTELLQGKTLLIERQMIRKDGSLVSVEVSSKLLTDGAVQAIARDITERKRAEQDLRLKSTALDSAGNGIVITDIRGTIEWINPAFTYLTGYSLDEVLGHNPRDLVRSGLHNHLFYEDLWSTILAGKVWKGELVNRRKDGTLYTEEQTITPVRDDTGQITHFVAIQQDVTARKLAEAAVHRLNTELEERVIERTTQLNHIKNRIESILNSNADSIVYSNINGFIEQINPAFTQTFGYEPHEIALQPLKALVAEKDIAEFEAAVANVTVNRQVQQVDVSSSRKDGSVFDAAMMLSPVIESGEQMVGIVVSIHDVTSRNLMLHHAMDLNELKSRYVAMAAHDLRNPMAVILSSTSGLEGYYDKLTPDRRQAKFDQIKSNIKVMTDILNDILVMGQVDSGKMDFRPAPLDLIALCQTLVSEAIEGSATTTKVDFVTQGINNWMLMDAKLLRHILSNLLSNAIKYSPAGSTVTFKARCIGENIEFTIRDEGIGIPKDDQARLFETFHRASNAKHIRGTGLGLAIVKQSVELHGGTISFESQEGHGTTFNILLPASES